MGPVYRGYGIVGEGNGMVIVYRGPGRGRGRKWRVVADGLLGFVMWCGAIGLAGNEFWS